MPFLIDIVLGSKSNKKIGTAPKKILLWSTRPLKRFVNSTTRLIDTPCSPTRISDWVGWLFHLSEESQYMYGEKHKITLSEWIMNLLGRKGRFASKSTVYNLRVFLEASNLIWKEKAKEYKRTKTYHNLKRGVGKLWDLFTTLEFFSRIAFGNQCCKRSTII